MLLLTYSFQSYSSSDRMDPKPDVDTSSGTEVNNNLTQQSRINRWRNSEVHLANLTTIIPKYHFHPRLPGKPAKCPGMPAKKTFPMRTNKVPLPRQHAKPDARSALIKDLFGEVSSSDEESELNDKSSGKDKPNYHMPVIVTGKEVFISIGGCKCCPKLKQFEKWC